MGNPVFDISDLYFSFGGQPVLEGLDLQLEGEHFHGIVGPNGSGKTTLLMLMLGYYQPEKGHLRFLGRDLTRLSRRTLARKIALVPQDFSIHFDFSVQEVVLMGRYPFLPRFSTPGREEIRKVEAVLEEMGLLSMKDRSVLSLSGGEKQWVVFARALAQDTPVLLLDEATSNMDIHHTLFALDRVIRQVTAGKTVIGVFHDLNLAAMYCDRLIFMSKGRVLAHGNTNEIFREDLIEKTFGVRGIVTTHPQSGDKQVFFRKEIRS